MTLSPTKESGDVPLLQVELAESSWGYLAQFRGDLVAETTGVLPGIEQITGLLGQRATSDAPGRAGQKAARSSLMQEIAHLSWPIAALLGDAQFEAIMQVTYRGLTDSTGTLGLTA